MFRVDPLLEQEGMQKAGALVFMSSQASGKGFQLIGCVLCLYCLLRKEHAQNVPHNSI